MIINPEHVHINNIILMKNNYMFQNNLMKQVALVYTFVSIFNVWLNTRQLDFCLCFYIQSVVIFVLVEVCEDNLAFNYTGI